MDVFPTNYPVVGRVKVLVVPSFMARFAKDNVAICSFCRETLQESSQIFRTFKLPALDDVVDLDILARE